MATLPNQPPASTRSTRSHLRPELAQQGGPFIARLHGARLDQSGGIIVAQDSPRPGHQLPLAMATQGRSGVYVSCNKSSRSPVEEGGSSNDRSIEAEILRTLARGAGVTFSDDRLDGIGPPMSSNPVCARSGEPRRSTNTQLGLVNRCRAPSSLRRRTQRR
jgi:hypothetical protein